MNDDAHIYVFIYLNAHRDHRASIHTYITHAIIRTSYCFCIL